MDTLTKEIPNGDRAPKTGNPRIGKGDTMDARVQARRNADLIKKAKATLTVYTFTSEAIANMVFDGILTLDFAKFYGLAIVKA